MVPPNSDRISRVPPYSGTSAMQPKKFRIRAFHPLWNPFPEVFYYILGLSLHGLTPLRPYNPEVRRIRFGLLPVRSPLLGESRLISSPAGTQMVHFPAYDSITLWIHAIVHDYCHVGYPIRISASLRVLAPHRSFSQLITSFFAWQLLGILRGPFLA